MEEDNLETLNELKKVTHKIPIIKAYKILKTLSQLL